MPRYGSLKSFFQLLVVLFLELSISPLLGPVKGVAVIFFPAFFFFTVCLLPPRLSLVYAIVFGVLRDSVSSYPPSISLTGFLLGAAAQQLLLYEINVEKVGARGIVAAVGVGVSYFVAYLLTALYTDTMSPSRHIFTETAMNGLWLLFFMMASSVSRMRFTR